MATCKSCDKSLPLFKVGLLNRRNNIIKCQKCGTYMAADKTTLTVIGGLIGGAAGSTFFLDQLFVNTVVTWSVIFTLAFSIIALGFLAQNWILNLKITEVIEHKVTSEHIDLALVPRPIELSKTRIEYLENLYSTKSTEELQDIISNKEMTAEAHLAANNLIDKRNNAL
jgi:hypothetical protein